MIVGHKIEQWLTVVILDHKNIYEVIFDVTAHRKTTELHATKGWRVARHTQKIHRMRRPPSAEDWGKNSFIRFERARRYKHHQHLRQLTPAEMERAAMRHKVRRAERSRAENLADLAAG